MINRFHRPVDGLPLEIFTHLTPILREYCSQNILLGWFEKIDQYIIPLDKNLREWIEYRNNRQAHGMQDDSIIEEWSDKTEKLIKQCLAVFTSVLPILNKTEIVFGGEFKNFRIDTPLLHENEIFIISAITQKKGIWKLKGQLVSKIDAKEFIIDLPEKNIFSIVGLAPIEKYKLESYNMSNGEEHIIEHNIPIRQTDIFVGRKSELNNLKDWMDDEDSRYALVYGDGGYGKTTLVLEFFNNVIEGKEDFKKSPPLIITYYTSKKTRWTEDGLTYYSNINDSMDECIRELMRCFHTVLSKEWYQISGKKLLDKAKGELVSQKYTRDDILFIIDNTETLALTQAEVTELGSFFKLIGKNLGRIVITSRRREFIESTPIVVEGLKEDESIELMRSIAKEYKAKAITALIKYPNNFFLQCPVFGR